MSTDRFGSRVRNTITILQRKCSLLLFLFSFLTGYFLVCLDLMNFLVKSPATTHTHTQLLINVYGRDQLRVVWRCGTRQHKHTHYMLTVRIIYGKNLQPNQRARIKSAGMIQKTQTWIGFNITTLPLSRKGQRLPRSDTPVSSTPISGVQIS